jgi:hypothetical protein
MFRSNVDLRGLSRVQRYILGAVGAMWFLASTCLATAGGNEEFVSQRLSALTEDLRAGRLARIEVAARQIGIETIAGLDPKSFDQMGFPKCRIPLDDSIDLALVKSIENPSVTPIEIRPRDLFWRLRFYDKAYNLVYVLYLGMAYINTTTIGITVDEHSALMDQSMVKWLEAHTTVDFDKCEFHA